MLIRLCLLLAALLYGAQSPASEPAPPAGGGPAPESTGAPPPVRTPSTASSPLAASSPAPLAAAWDFPVEGTSVPFVVGLPDRIVVATPGGALAAHGTDGKPLWQRSLETPLARAPLALPGRIAVLGRDGRIVLIDAGTGEPAARAGPFGPGSHLSALNVGLAVADPAGTLTVIDPESGRTHWSASVTDSPTAPAGQCGGVVLVGTAQGTVAALSAGEGRLLWRTRIGEAITTAPGCFRRLAYVGSADNRLHAFKVGKRRANPVWSYTTGGDIVGRPFLYGGRVLFFSFDTYLYALEADNGHLAWKVRLGRRPQAESVVMGGVLVVAPLNTERLETFQLPEGTQGPAFALPAGEGRFVSPPVAVGDRVAVAAAGYGHESARVIGLAPIPAVKRAP
jgi:outer membrane protein assembly factor BamB